MEKVNEKVLFGCLWDSFIQHLRPETVLKHNPWFNAYKPPDSSASSISPEDFFGWILANESGAAIQQFKTALRQLISYHENSATITVDAVADDATAAAAAATTAKETSELVFVKHVIKLLDGSLVNNISKSELDIILALMLAENMIIKTIHDQAKEKKDPQKGFMTMFKNITGNKSNWPIVFFSSVSKIRSDLVQPESLGSIQPGDCSRADGANKSENPGVLLDVLADFNEDIGNKIYMTAEERNSEKIQKWIATGNFDVNNIMSEEQYQKQQEKRASSSDHYISDDEDDDDKKEKTPSLNLREYQKELSEVALRGENTIVWAPTGSGKTRVAINIIHRHLEQQNETKKRKVAFFARTVPLVMQQYRCLSHFLPKQFKVTHMTGDNRNCLHMENVIPENDVIVMTPRILENHLRKNKQDHVDVFTLLVFDECHHTRKDGPYNTLMHLYFKRRKQISEMRNRGEAVDIRLPQIVGLTASIGVEKAKSVPEAADSILQVMGNLDVDNISSVKKNIKELNEQVSKCKEDLYPISERPADAAADKIVKKMTEFENRIRVIAAKLKNEDLNELLKHIPDNKKNLVYGHWTVVVQKLAKSLPRRKIPQASGWKRSLIILSDYLATYNVALELHDLVHLRDVMAFLDKCFHKYKQNRHCTEDENVFFESFSDLGKTMEDQLRAENPNLTILKQHLLNHLVQKGKDSLGIIFVRTRALTSAIASWLRSCGDEKIERLNAIPFTGTTATAADGGMTVAQQSEAINKLENKISRIMVATSVAEEGIDLPKCDMVIKYNYVGNEITTVQSRGRCRMKDGVSTVLAMPKIIEKERDNKMKAEMMVNAINFIGQKDISEIREKNRLHQIKILAEEEAKEEMARRKCHQLQKTPFKMICHGCDELVIDSKDIRTLYDAHHVVVDTDILHKTKTFPDGENERFDDILKIGPALCSGTLENGESCNTKIGTLMIFSNVPFVVLKAGLGFQLPGMERLPTFKKWKNVPYFVDEIDSQDFESYLP